MPLIFLSSTFVDLADIRKEITEWLSQVFGADLIIMETFGSDAAPPDVTSVRKVEDCDIFIGVYAHRYGTVDPTSGKSITELELDEAERANSAGVVRDVLLYLHDERELWPSAYKESSTAGMSKMMNLRERARSHTISYFKNAHELLLAITRDVHRKLIEHFHSSPLQIQAARLPGVTKLDQPVGMEFLRSTQRQHLIGRASKLDELVTGIDQNHLLLLLGDSGVGKTSLIHAGLMPESLRIGWHPVYVRPLGLPASDVVHHVQSSLFKGRPAYRGPLLPFLLEVSELVPENRLLVVIDQFEDVLVARNQEEAEKLVADLTALYQSPRERLRVVLSYRADLEGRLGHLWQLISGSPAGLPRVYVEGLSPEDVQAGILKAMGDLGISAEIDGSQWERIKRDLELASAALGLKAIYPPHVQMLIDQIWTSTNRGEIPYTAALYRKTHGVNGIIGDYLGRQLHYADDPAGNVRLVLTGLVRSYGVKAQKRMDELVADTGLDQKDVETALERLIDLRLVRHIESYYEITHDFIARKVVSELVDSEEKEFKRFQELLSSKGAAFSATGARLTSQELLMLYKHRERVVPGEPELRLLLVSWLEGDGPGLYWLLNAEWKSQILGWIASELSNDDSGRDRKAAATLLKLRLERGRITAQDFVALKRYEYTIELASILQQNAASLSEDLILAGLRHQRGEVRSVCKSIIKARLCEGKWSLLPKIRDSAAKHFWDMYAELVTDGEVPMPPSDRSRLIEEFRNLKTIGSGATEQDSAKAYTRLKTMKPQRRSLLLGWGVLAVRRGRIGGLLTTVKSRPLKDVEVILGALAGGLKPDDFTAALAAYEQWNKSEPVEPHAAPAIYGKARALADAVADAMKPDLAAKLRATVSRIRLSDSARSVVLALLKHGQIEDVELVLNRVRHEKSRVGFWTHTELAQAVARRMTEVQAGVPVFLMDIINRKEFWTYDPDVTLDTQEQLQLGSSENRSLYIRLAAYAAIGSAAGKDVEWLLRFTTHDYTLIARAAAVRLVHLLGESALRRLRSAIKGDISERPGKSLAGAIRFAEVEKYGVANVW